MYGNDIARKELTTNIFKKKDTLEQRWKLGLYLSFRVLGQFRSCLVFLCNDKSNEMQYSVIFSITTSSLYPLKVSGPMIYRF